MADRWFLCSYSDSITLTWFRVSSPFTIRPKINQFPPTILYNHNLNAREKRKKTQNNLLSVWEACSCSNFSWFSGLPVQRTLQSAAPIVRAPPSSKTGIWSSPHPLGSHHWSSGGIDRTCLISPCIFSPFQCSSSTRSRALGAGNSNLEGPVTMVFWQLWRSLNKQCFLLVW